jgi:hypothetical protein
MRHQFDRCFENRWNVVLVEIRNEKQAFFVSKPRDRSGTSELTSGNRSSEYTVSKQVLPHPPSPTVTSFRSLSCFRDDMVTCFGIDRWTEWTQLK